MSKRPKRTPRDYALIGQVWAELGSGRITEAFIRDGRNMTDGVTWGRHIWVNPAHQTADTVIHECLHRMHPSWTEAYVRRTTTYIRRRMGDDEVIALVDEFNKRARKRKRPLSVGG